MHTIYRTQKAATALEEPGQDVVEIGLHAVHVCMHWYIFISQPYNNYNYCISEITPGRNSHPVAQMQQEITAVDYSM